jgi:8-oxo-dGTP diphosphatase
MNFKISCLLFIKNQRDQILMLQRRKSPNRGFWSPPGGKLKMEDGESPFECARREAKEETGLNLGFQDLHLFGYVSEKNYEGMGHWLMFLFESQILLDRKPPSFDEGSYEFYSRPEIDSLNIPPSDAKLIWPFYDRRDVGFWGINADCATGEPKLMVEACPEV